MSQVLVTPPRKTLQDAEFKAHLQRLRQTDNCTNWYYIARTWAFLLLVLGASIGFDLYRQSQGWSLLWSVPVFLVAIVVVGAAQHQLTALGHEGSHYILFKHRLLNEFCSDWFCMFPVFSTTHHYRLQHLAHHQFVNDPERDPNIGQLRASGHWLSFPIQPRQLLRMVLRQLWLPNLIRFTLIRARDNSTGAEHNPYVPKGVRQSRVAVRGGLLYLLTLSVALGYGVYRDNLLFLTLVPGLLWVAAVAFFALLPARMYHQSKIRSPITQKPMTILRISFLTLIALALAWTQYLTGVWAWVYFVLLWVLPVFTSFSFFMIVRDWVQHGNADRGWLTNTRVFAINPLFNYAVLPLGQDYHLPHHLYATVPHYRLRELHTLLLDYPEYREQAVEVHGCFTSTERPKVHPTLLEVLGPEYAPREFHGVYLDHTVLDNCNVADREQIESEAERDRRRLIEASTKP